MFGFVHRYNYNWLFWVDKYIVFTLIIEKNIRIELNRSEFIAHSIRLFFLQAITTYMLLWISLRNEVIYKIIYIPKQGEIN